MAHAGYRLARTANGVAASRCLHAATSVGPRPLGSCTCCAAPACPLTPCPFPSLLLSLLLLFVADPSAGRPGGGSRVACEREDGFGGARFPVQQIAACISACCRGIASRQSIATAVHAVVCAHVGRYAPCVREHACNMHAYAHIVNALVCRRLSPWEMQWARPMEACQALRHNLPCGRPGAQTGWSAWLHHHHHHACARGNSLRAKRQSCR